MTTLLNSSCESSPNLLTEPELQLLINEVNDWKVDKKNNVIYKTFQFKNYYKTMAFINATAWIIYQENHHPEINITYNTCSISFSTHSVNGLSKNDFICASKINNLLSD